MDTSTDEMVVQEEDMVMAVVALAVKTDVLQTVQTQQPIPDGLNNPDIQQTVRDKIQNDPTSVKVLHAAFKIIDQMNNNDGLLHVLFVQLDEEFEEFCLDPNNQMQEGVDFKFDGDHKIALISIRAWYHYRSTRMNLDGASFRDKMLKLIKDLYEQYQNVREGRATKPEWEKMRERKKNISKLVIREETTHMMKHAKPHKTITEKEANKKTRISPAIMHKIAYRKMFNPGPFKTITNFCKKKTKQMDPKNLSSNFDEETNHMLAHGEFVFNLERRAGKNKEDSMRKVTDVFQQIRNHPGWSNAPNDHLHPLAVRPQKVQVVLANGPAATGAPPPPAAIGNA